MATIFGNINNMTLAQFKKAIEYYENKINTLKEDVSLSDNAKAYFTNLYKNRVKSLTKTQQKLEAVIANARTAGIYVNEKTATFNSLGKPQSGPNDFELMAQNQKKYKRAQFFRILGIVLLPLVGTIPFIRAYKRAKQKYKDIQNAMSKENTDLKTFVHNEHRPYDNKLTTSESLSNEEIEQILTLPGEVARLENILTSSSLSPAEKKNLTAKLIEIKTYAQENGLTLDPTVLTSSKFDTEKDKAVKNINTIKTDVATETTFTPSSLNIKQLHEKYEKLTVIAEKITAALDESPDNADLLTAQTKINTSIQNVKTEVQNQVTSESNKIISDLNGKKAKSSAKSDFDNSNTALDAIYNSVSTKFGTSLEETKTIASELGGDVSAIEKITETYNNLKNNNNSKLAEIETAENNKKTFDEELAKVKSFNTTWSSKISSFKSEDILPATEAIAKTDISISTLESLYKYIEDATILSEFSTASIEYNSLKKKINAEKQKQELNLGELNECKEKIDNFNYDSSKKPLEQETDKILLSNYLSIFESEDSRKSYEKAGMLEDWAKTIAHGKEELKKIETKIFENNHKWDDLKNEIDTLTLNPSDEYDVLKTKQERLIEISELLKTDDYKNLTGVEPYKIKTVKHLSSITKEIEKRDKNKEYEQEWAKKIENIENEINNLISSLETAPLTTDKSKLTKTQREIFDSNKNIYTKLSKINDDITETIINSAKYHLSGENLTKLCKIQSDLQNQLKREKSFTL